MDTQEWTQPRNALKRKIQESPASNTFSHPTKYQILNPNDKLTDDDSDFQAVSSGPTSRIPPLIITNPQLKWVDFRKQLKSNHPDESFNGKASGENFRLQMKTPTGYRLAVALLRSNGIQYSTYGFKENNPIKAVVRNIPSDIPTKEIKQDLIDQGIPTQNVHQLKKSVGTEKVTLPIFFINVDRNDGGKKIFQVTEILNIKVQVETYHKGDNITQCHKCQRYGHSQNHCNNNPRCVKCAGPQLTNDCLHKTRMLTQNAPYAPDPTPRIFDFAPNATHSFTT
ncbi:hypothetical protein JTE90_021128 [Oedothorax gibbosus]|uniref:Pre-C2HC domain-containing protein n=1 Tax=Oedothorax gibbosus TaxID=931172 RepID=A0AAV6TX45_9ARAC|nr:hypothetical protein JTE90_021128 [Oedothorax gibbosus]